MRLTLGTQRAGHWATLVNHVQQKRGSVSRQYRFLAEGGSTARGAIRYTLKASADTGTGGKWTLQAFLNGKLVEALTAANDIDLTSLVRPGKNVLRLVGDWKGDTSPVTVIVGTTQDGKWSALVHATHQKQGHFQQDFPFEATETKAAAPPMPISVGAKRK